jgi:hypothetical protein
MVTLLNSEYSHEAITIFQTHFQRRPHTCRTQFPHLFLQILIPGYHISAFQKEDKMEVNLFYVANSYKYVEENWPSKIDKFPQKVTGISQCPRIYNI